MADLEKLFAKSDETDAILIVKKKKLHVNKALLSYHSDYFKALFNSEFKEKSMKEIEIKDVSFEEFATLLSLVQQNPAKPTCYVAESVLDLADRFLLPQVKSLLELILITSDLDFWSKVKTGGRHQLNDLLDNGLNEMHKYSIYSIHDLRASDNFSKLPASAQVKILTRYLELFHFY